MPPSLADPVFSASPIMRRASPLPLPTNYQLSTTPPRHSSGNISNLSNISITSNTNIPNNSMVVGAGKTSQVIEKLTSENERLRRELKAERAAKDELVQQQRALKLLVDQLEGKNSILKHQFETHDGALARKARKVDDLRTQLETETNRRRQAEIREAEMGRKLGDTTADASKAVAEARDKQKQSDGAYNTVSKEYLELKARVETAVVDFDLFKKTNQQENQSRETRFVQLEILLDQKRQALEQATKVNREQAMLLSQYKGEISETVLRKHQMIETTNQMRWVMGLHKARTKESEGQGEGEDEAS